MQTQLANLKKHKSLFAALRALKSADEGVTSVEYAILASGIGIVLVTAATALGSQIVATFNTIAAAMAG